MFMQMVDEFIRGGVSNPGSTRDGCGLHVPLASVRVSAPIGWTDGGTRHGQSQASPRRSAFTRNVAAPLKLKPSSE
jgi:hypothetical protein